MDLHVVDGDDQHVVIEHVQLLQENFKWAINMDKRREDLSLL